MTYRRNRHGRRHDQRDEGDHHNQRIRRNHAGQGVAPREQTDRQQQHDGGASLHGPDRAHNRRRSGAAIAAFTQELKVDERGTDAGRHGNGGEAGCHLRAIQADRIAFVGIHEHAQGNGGTKPCNKTESNANQGHSEIRVSDRFDHLGRLDLCEHHIYGNHQQGDGEEGTEAES